jgi:hypothetical protein
MATAKSNVVVIGSKSHGEIDKAEQIGYAGPDLVPGSYVVKTGKTWILKTNKNGDPMISVPLNVEFPKGHPKAKFNGASVWYSMNLTEQAAPFNNRFLDACDIDPKRFHGAKAQTEPGSGDNQKIVKMKGLDGDFIELGGHLLTVAVKKNGNYLNVDAFAPYDPEAASATEDEAEENEAPWDEDETDGGTDSDPDDDF